MTEGIIAECEKYLAELKKEMDKRPHTDLGKCNELIINLKVWIFLEGWDQQKILVVDNSAAINTAFGCATQPSRVCHQKYAVFEGKNMQK